MVMIQNVTEGGLILFRKISVLTIELPKRRFQTFLDISLPEKLRIFNELAVRGVVVYYPICLIQSSLETCESWMSVLGSVVAHNDNKAADVVT